MGRAPGSSRVKPQPHAEWVATPPSKEFWLTAPVSWPSLANILALCALAAPLLIASALARAEYSYSISYGVEASDNIGLTSANTERDVIGTTELRFDWARRSPKLTGRVAFRGQHLNYENDTFDDEFRPELDMDLVWQPIRDRLTWTVADVARQQRIDVAGAPNPNNVQTVNLLTTGPDVFFRFGPRSTLRLGARYSDASFEETNEDNQRVNGNAGWIYELSSTTKLSLNAGAETVKFENDALNDEFDRRDVFFQISSTAARSSLVLDLGQSTIDPESAEKIDEPLLRLAWRRQLTERSNLGIELAREVSDVGRDIAVRIGDTQTRSGDLFVDRRFSIFHDSRFRRMSTTVRLYARDADYEVAALDERNIGGTLSLEHRLSRTVSASIQGEAVRREFLDLVPDRIDREYSYGLSLSYRPGRRVFFALSGRWRSRESDDPAQDYRETLATLQVGYNSGSGQ